MKLDDVIRIGMLYDFYGSLLPDRQRGVMELYYQENLSLSEIAEEFSISRQGVHDALKNAEKSLQGYEDKLGLAERFRRTGAAVRRIDGIIDSMISSAPSEELVSMLKEVKEIIDKLED